MDFSMKFEGSPTNLHSMRDKYENMFSGSSSEFQSVSFYDMNCVWDEDPRINMCDINKMLDSIDEEIANDHYKNQTPSNICDMLSSSFPSGTFSASDTEDEMETGRMPFIASTPCGEIVGKTAKRRRTEAFNDFVSASPVFSTPKPFGTTPKRTDVLSRRKLNMDEDFNESDEIEQKVKIMKI